MIGKRKLHIHDFYDGGRRCPHCGSEDLGVSFNFDVDERGLISLGTGKEDTGARLERDVVVLICEACGSTVDPHDTVQRESGSREEGDKKE